MTCEQPGVEVLPSCTRRSLVYENLCMKCNQGAMEKGEEEQLRMDIPTIYVGETSISIFERRREHWNGVKKWSNKNHMVAHQTMEHGGEQPPKFLMRVVSNHRSALERQVAEAVRIRRRGGEGAVLNSRGEFNRSYIPRLRVVEEEEPEEERTARLENREHLNRDLREQDLAWETSKVGELGAGAFMGTTTSPKKRGQEGIVDGGGAPGSKRRKKALKYQKLGEQWGEPEIPKGAEPAAPQDREPAPSRIPREQELTQSSILGYMEPAPLTPRLGVGGECPTTGNQVTSEQSRPTTGNLVSSPGLSPCTTRRSGGGSPCVRMMGSQLNQVCQDIQLEVGVEYIDRTAVDQAEDDQESTHFVGRRDDDDKSMDMMIVARVAEQSMGDE